MGKEINGYESPQIKSRFGKRIKDYQKGSSYYNNEYIREGIE
jgi:hypothetical protein